MAARTFLSSLLARFHVAIRRRRRPASSPWRLEAAMEEAARDGLEASLDDLFDALDRNGVDLTSVHPRSVASILCVEGLGAVVVSVTKALRRERVAADDARRQLERRRRAMIDGLVLGIEHRLRDRCVRPELRVRVIGAVRAIATDCFEERVGAATRGPDVAPDARPFYKSESCVGSCPPFSSDRCSRAAERRRLRPNE